MSQNGPDTTEAEAFLNKQGIPFTRLLNGELKVKGGLDLTGLGLRHLPDLSCVVVMGNVDCRGNNLISTAGMPRHVAGMVFHDDAVVEDMAREAAIIKEMPADITINPGHVVIGHRRPFSSF